MTGRVDVVSHKLTTFLQIYSPILIQGLILKQGEGVSIGCSRNIDGEGPSATIKEIQLDCKADRFFRHKSNLNSDHLPCDTQIAATEISHSQINIRKLLGDCMFQIDVFIASVVDLQDGFANLSASDCGKDEVWFVEEESGVASLGLNCHLHVAP